VGENLTEKFSEEGNETLTSSFLKLSSQISMDNCSTYCYSKEVHLYFQSFYQT